MRPSRQPSKKQDIAGLVIQDVYCEAVGPGSSPGRRGQCWPSSEDDIRRGGKIVKVLESRSSAVHTIEINGNRLIISLAAGEMNTARNKVQFLPVLKVRGGPGVGVAFILALQTNRGANS